LIQFLSAAGERVEAALERSFGESGQLYRAGMTCMRGLGQRRARCPDRARRL